MNKILLGLFVVLTLLNIIQWVLLERSKKEKAELVVNLTKHRDSVTNSLNQVVYSTRVQLGESQRELKEVTQEKFNLEKKHEKEIKKVHAFYASRTKVELDSVLVPYKDTSWTKHWKDSVKANCAGVIMWYEDSTVLIGTKATDSSKFYKVDMTVQKQGVEINNIQFVDSQYVRFVTVKGGFFKKVEGKRKFHVKRSLQVQVLHTNPHFKNTGMDAIMYDPPKKKGGLIRGIIIGGTVIYTLTEILPLIL